MEGTVGCALCWLLEIVIFIFTSVVDVQITQKSGLYTQYTTGGLAILLVFSGLSELMKTA